MSSPTLKRLKILLSLKKLIGELSLKNDEVLVKKIKFLMKIFLKP
jgi:hypothetical protein